MAPPHRAATPEALHEDGLNHQGHGYTALPAPVGLSFRHAVTFKGLMVGAVTAVAAP
jgi:hypothetical protein